MWQEFRKFILRGNVIDLAVGIIIGASFNTIVQSLVNDILMPPIGLVIGRLDFANLMWVLRTGSENPGPYKTPADAAAAGAVTINYGLFINNIISFLIVGLAVFFLVRAVNRLYVRHEKEAPEPAPVEKECPFCKKDIPIQAIRCPFCTSELGAQAISS